jgi:hypothetical protein
MPLFLVSCLREAFRQAFYPEASGFHCLLCEYNEILGVSIWPIISVFF